MSRLPVAVVGGGVLGTSIAYWLARLGLPVALFEAGVAGAEGASRDSSGILRSFDFDPSIAALSARGTALMHGWTAGGLPGLTPVRATPLLWLLDDARAEAAAAVLRSLPALARVATLRPIAAARTEHPVLASCRAPWVLSDTSGGLTDVRLTVRNLLQGVRQLGGRIFEHCPVVALRRRGSGGVDIELASGVRTTAAWAVLAAGRATATLAPELPVCARTVPLVRLQGGAVAGGGPVIDQTSGTYLRPLGDGDAYLGWAGREFVGGPPPETDRGEAASHLTALAATLGWTEMPRIVDALRCADAYTRDCRPIVRFAEHERSCIATGLSGRGFKFAVALGAAIARALAQRMALAFAPGCLPEGIEDLAVGAGAEWGDRVAV